MESQGIDYPVAIDVGKKTVKAFAVDSFPDYYVIDRAGNLRFADLANSELDRAVAMLLAEEAPASNPIQAALDVAAKKDKRVLALVGSEAEIASGRAALKGDREFTRFVSYEYEVAAFEPAAFGIAPNTDKAGLDVQVYDAAGKLLGSYDGKLDDREALTGFLKKHQVPAKDAEAQLAAALARAERENKRVLVHLGAPW